MVLIWRANIDESGQTMRRDRNMINAANESLSFHLPAIFRLYPESSLILAAASDEKTHLPLRLIPPLSGVSRPANILNSVVLPHPEGPRRGVKQPDAMTISLPNVLVMFFSLISTMLTWYSCIYALCCPARKHRLILCEFSIMAFIFLHNASFKLTIIT